jgi:hypothetical protein
MQNNYALSRRAGRANPEDIKRLLAELDGH